MLERHNDELGHEMILVSRTGVVVFILFSLVMTAVLMGLFMFVDFDSLLGRKHLAMKVGQTSISLEDFKKIKSISGSRAQAMPDQAWAEELFTTLILAEDARNHMLDQDPELKIRVETFNAALNKSEDEERVARSVFLHEELAKASINRLLQSNADYKKLLEETGRTTVAQSDERLHLRMFTLVSQADLEAALSSIASGATLDQINASFSVSPYRGVGGDIGWKSAADLPEEVFARLSTAEKDELVEGFRDESGIHLFAIVDRPQTKLLVSNEKQLQQLKNKLISQHLIKLRTEIDFWINPTLRAMCQISPAPAPEPSN